MFPGRVGLLAHSYYCICFVQVLLPLILLRLLLCSSGEQANCSLFGNPPEVESLLSFLPAFGRCMYLYLSSNFVSHLVTLLEFRILQENPQAATKPKPSPQVLGIELVCDLNDAGWRI